MNFGIRFSSPAQKELSPKATKIVVFIFSTIFILVGTSLEIMFLRGFFYERAVADRAVEVPCEIVFAEIESSHSDRGTSFSPKIAYEYQYNFQEFASEKIEFSQSFSSGDYGKAKKRLNALKNRTTCWVDPDDPSRAALERPTGEFSWPKFLPILFPLAFVFFGVLVLVLFLINSRKEKAKLAAAGTPVGAATSSSPVNPAGTQIPESAEPVPAEPPLWLAKIISLAGLIFPIIWTSIACYFMGSFICSAWPENTPISAGTLVEFFKENSIMLIFSGSFVLVGFSFLFASIRQFILDRRAAERSRDEAFERNRGKWER